MWQDQTAQIEHWDFNYFENIYSRQMKNMTVLKVS